MTFVRLAGDGGFVPVEPGISVRDLGVGTLTSGELMAQVVRIQPEGAYVEKLHRHDEGFSLAYVLRGWLDVEFQQIGIHHLGPWTVTPAYNGPMHRELACGDEFELLLLVTRQSVSGDDEQHIIVQQERDTPYVSRGPFLYRDFGLTKPTAGRLVAYALKAPADSHAPRDATRTTLIPAFSTSSTAGWRSVRRCRQRTARERLHGLRAAARRPHDRGARRRRGDRRGQNFSLNGRTSISIVQALRSWCARCQ